MISHDGLNYTIWYVLYSTWIGLTCYFVFKVLMEMSWSRRHAQAVEFRKQKCVESFAVFRQRVAESNIDEDLVEEILSLEFPQLRRALQCGKYTPTQVHLAYADVIGKINVTYNCVAECIVESFDMVKSLEEKYKDSDEKPYLYGVPFSVKSNFYLKGHDCCIGLSKFLDEKKNDTCTFVEVLMRLGGIPICITNVPQGLMSFVCSNPIFGTTQNPHKDGFTPGGSSGGEACLVARKGIPFGIGSDLAGSLRIPAHMSGVVSLKPSELRFAVYHTHGGMPGKARIGLSNGFFTRSVDEQIELLDVLLNSDHYQTLRPAHSVIQKFDMAPADRQFEKGLKIGYYTHNGFIQPVPACSRAVLEVVNRIKGPHKVTEFAVPDPTRMAWIVLSNIASDGFEYWREIFANEKLDPYMKQFVFTIKIPRFIKRILSCVLSSICPELALMCRTGVYSAGEVRRLFEDTDLYKEQFFKAWNEADLDALIVPAFPVTAVPHSYPQKLGVVAVETALYNVLDCPAGVVPVTKVTSDDIAKLTNDKEFPVGWNLTRKLMMESGLKTEGLPVGVQIVTKPYEEEKCLRIMKEIERIMKDQ